MFARREIRGRKVLITGAAGGIGRAISLELARQGADLYLFDIDETGLGDVVAQAQALGVEAVGVQCDLTRPDEVTACIQTMLDRWGYIDTLVNNAGVAYYGPTLKMSQEHWDWLLRINLHAPIQITRELLPTLLERPEPHILNISSIFGLVASGRSAAYHVSKFGLVGFSEALRAEFGRRGMGVTLVCPGPVRTNLYRDAVSGKTDRSVPDPPGWICCSPQRVAAKAVRALRRNRRMVLVTPVAHFFWNLKRFAPGLIDLMHHIGRRRKQRSRTSTPQEVAAARSPDAREDRTQVDDADGTSSRAA